jgi:hypothetical protein
MRARGCDLGGLEINWLPGQGGWWKEPTWATPGPILDRQTLYDLVWSKPTAYLAQEYGISDVALRKMCQGLNVP